MRLTLKEEPREWAKFTLGTAVALAVLSLLLRWRGVLPTRGLAAALAIAALLGLACLLRPRWFRAYYRAGLTLSYRIGQALGQVWLALFFLLVLTPIGLLLRAWGKDLLRLRRRPEAESYWEPARNESPLDRMF